MLRRIWTIFVARNKEFFRDKSALGWNIAFPFLVIIGFSLMFSDNHQVLYKVAVINVQNETTRAEDNKTDLLDKGLYKSKMTDSQKHFKYFTKSKFVEFITFDPPESAFEKLKHHRIDMVIAPGSGKYWISDTAPNGYITERLLHAAAREHSIPYSRESIAGEEVPFVEWLFPGILGMNMMFSALFGVGYVVVRYRKNGVLKRLSVTPLKPYEFLTAQIISRMFLLLSTTTIVYVGCVLLYGFTCRGSYLSLFFVFALGGFCMVSMGLLVAARSSSEEFAGGVLNLITWPMMFLSEVWFSLEGAHPWVKKFSLVFPLTHMIDSVRKIMNDGYGLVDIRFHILTLCLMSLFFMLVGSFLFKWQKP